jgi:hypothetical protein
MGAAMQYLLMLVLIFTILAMLAGFGWGGSRGVARGARACDELARHYRGRVHRAGWFGHPRVSFRHRSVDVRVGIFAHGSHGTGHGSSTRLQTAWLDANFSCSISHPARPPRLTDHDGLISWRSGWRDFDQRYSIRTSDRTLTAALMNRVALHQIEQLRRQPHPGGLLVEIHRGVFQISKSSALGRPADLLAFVRVGLELHDQTLLSATEGIAFLQQPVAQPLEHVVCQVCGEQIVDDLVFCRRCKTPHHRDCWQYVGRCSVFGCGEIHFEIPRPAAGIPRRPND